MGSHKRMFWTTMFCTGIAATAYARGVDLALEEVIGEDGYNKTYTDESKSFGTRMKEARSIPDTTPQNTHGGFYLGVNGDFGPVFDANPAGSSGMGLGMTFGPGYAIQTDSWNRLEFGFDVGYHSFTWKGLKSTDSTMTPLTFAPKFGYGFSLGQNLFGIVRFGFGLATGQVSQKYAEGSKSESYKTDSKTGFLVTSAYDVSYKAEKFQFLGGLGVDHYQYSFSATRNNLSEDYKVNLNHVNVHGGVRVLF